MNDIRDISLAPSGELKIAWVRRNMAVLRGIEADFAAEKPFAGMKIALSVHLEADHPTGIAEALRRMEACKVKKAVALRPITAPSAVLPYLEGLDMVLVMTVEPGFGGQAFLEHQLDTIRQVRALIERYNPACRLEVDGGINAKTAAAVVAAGADTLVAGSAVYGAAEPAVAIAALRGD